MRQPAGARERRAEITKLLLERGSVRVSDLSHQFGVSDVTVRSDLAALERQGALQRIHGGAVRPVDGSRLTPFQDRLGRNGRLKRWIGRRAAALIDDGERIFIDSSTTAYAVLSGLQERSGLTVVTDGLDAARSASENPRNRVTLVGGLLRPGRASLAGPAAASCSGRDRRAKWLDERDVRQVEVVHSGLKLASDVRRHVAGGAVPEPDQRPQEDLCRKAESSVEDGRGVADHIRE